MGIRAKLGHSSSADSYPSVIFPSSGVRALLHGALLFHPRHHCAEAAPHFFDGVIGALLLELLEAGLTGLVFRHPFVGEFPASDLVPHAAHRLLRFRGDDARASREVTVLGGIADRVAHVADAALVDEIDDELELVTAFEVRHFGRVTGLDERLEAGLNESREPSAEHGLLAE